jgi:3-hydroxyacyl-CoA dehydrogenase
MGGDIAAIGAMAGLDVTLTDMNEAAIVSQSRVLRSCLSGA